MAKSLGRPVTVDIPEPMEPYFVPIAGFPPETSSTLLPNTSIHSVKGGCDEKTQALKSSAPSRPMLALREALLRRMLSTAPAVQVVIEYLALFAIACLYLAVSDKLRL